MLKYLLTAIYLGLLVCLLYQPLSIPDDDSMIDQYRPSFQPQSTHDKTNQSSNDNQNIAIQDLQKDSIIAKENHILVDSTP